MCCFLLLGAPRAAADPPSIINTPSRAGMCADEARFAAPVHLDRTSVYVHDTGLVIRPNGGSPYTIAIGPASAAAPVLDVKQFNGAVDGAYAIGLVGKYGFDAVGGPEPAAARVTVPHSASWSVTQLPHQPAISGESFDAVASSSAAPCLSRAEIQIGSAPPVPLEIKALSDRRASIDGVPDATASHRSSAGPHCVDRGDPGGAGLRRGRPGRAQCRCRDLRRHDAAL